MLPGPLSPELGVSALNSYMWSTGYDARGLLDLERMYRGMYPPLPCVRHETFH